MRSGGKLCVALVLVTFLISGCRFDGFNSLPLPFAVGTGPGSYTVTVSMANIGNLVPNAEVKVNDVTVGTVRAVRFQDWQGILELSLEHGLRLPASTTAKVGQKSLLGAEYLELDRPLHAGPPDQDLVAGSHIPLSRTGRFPETEEVLAAASLLLNGGGLSQLQTVVSELNNALGGGHTGELSRDLPQLQALARGLEGQRQSIELTIDSLDRLSGHLAQGNQALDEAIRRLSPGVEVLATERPDLTRTFAQLGELSTSAHRIVDSSGSDLTRSVHDLLPVARELAKTGNDLPLTLKYAVAPFGLDNVLRVFRGDYLNGYATIDVTPETLAKNFFGTSAAGKAVGPAPSPEPSGATFPGPLLPPNIGGTGPPQPGAKPGPVPKRPSDGEDDGKSSAPTSSPAPRPPLDGGPLAPLPQGG